MKNADNTAIISRHQDAFKRFGHHPNALLWSSIKIQYLRFEQLSKIGIKSGDSLLDVGCGFADLYFYLKQNSIVTHYFGIDIVSEFTDKARSIYPDADFLNTDVFSLNAPSDNFDYTLLSGTLNYTIKDADKNAKNTINTMFDLCKKGMGFNLLDNTNKYTSSRGDLQTYCKEDVELWVKSLTNNYQIIDNYLDNDFTVLVWK